VTTLEARRPSPVPLLTMPATERRSTMSLLHKTGWGTAAGLVAVSGRFLVTIFSARHLGLEGLGRLAYLLWIIELTATVTGFGMQSCVTRYLADLRAQGRDDAAASLATWLYRRYLLITVLGATVLVVVAVSTQHRGLETAVWTNVGVCLVLQAMGTFYLAYLAGEQRFDRPTRVNLVSAGCLVLGVAIGMKCWGLAGTIAGYAAGSVLPAVLSSGLLKSGSVNYELDPRLKSSCIRYACFAWWAAVVSACVWSRIEVVFLERYWGAQEVAMFSVGLTLSSLAVQGPMLLGGALMPHFAESMNALNMVEHRQVYSRTIRLLAALLFPLCMGLASVMPVVLPMVYGGTFRSAVPISMVLAAFSVLSLMSVSSALVYASGKAWFIAVSGCAGAVLSIAGCALVIPIWGAWGAALSRSAVQTVVALLGTWYISKHLGCPAPVRSLACILFSSALAALCSYTIIIRTHGFGALAIALPAACAVYLMMLRLTSALHQEDIASLRNALARVPVGISWPFSGLLGWFAS
jgi:O-antigen/teichoic acid export membrane protein